MTAIVDIYNAALMEVGHSQAIADPSENTNAANLCRTFYPICRDLLLEDADWNFATKRVVLALLPDTQSNWAYAYAYPADVLRVRDLVLPGMRFVPHDWRPAYEVANVNSARAILTDLADAEAVYTARVENPNLFTSQFVSTLAYLLASRIAMPLTGKPDVAAAARQGYLLSLASARAANLGEGHAGPMPDCEFNAVRNITTDQGWPYA